MISGQPKNFFRNLLMTTAVLFILSLVGCKDVNDHSASDIKVPAVVQQIPDAKESLPITIKDLSALAIALESFKQDHRRYPINFPKGTRGWEGLYSEEGITADWVHELSPKYLKSIPADPKSDGGSKAHYLYASDGANYKLIIFQVGNCDAIKRYYSTFVDPTRNCDAYGIWTPRAAGW